MEKPAGGNMSKDNSSSDLTLRGLQAQFPGLLTFRCVANHLNFARAAEDLGVTPTAVSKAIRQLEAQMGLRLFNRNTRSVALTEAGQKLISQLEPALEKVKLALESATSDTERPAGVLRLNSPYPAYAILIEPYLQGFLEKHPEIIVEVSLDNTLADIVAGGFDAGIRLGHAIQRDMIAARLGTAQMLVAVASSDYLERHGAPSRPQDLLEHQCIRQRFASQSRFLEWTFKVDGKPAVIDVRGQLVVDEMRLAAGAARKGAGIAYVFRQLIEEDIASGRLVVLLEKYCVDRGVFHIYYPSGRQLPGKLRVFIDHIRQANPSTSR
jgi:DNA-binding transcriptional LysR family regulator